MTPLLAQYRATLPADQRPPVPPQRNIVQEYLLPLTFEPGTEGKWQYGCGLEWTGLVIERLNHGMRLGDYMSLHIFARLGMKETTFRPLQRAELLQRLCPLVVRLTDGTVEADTVGLTPLIDPYDDSGGGGIYTTAGDYVRVLESLLRDDGRILGEEMVREMFRPQFGESEELQVALEETGIAGAMGRLEGKEILKGVRWNHGLAGVVAVDGVPGVAEKGTMWWWGLPSCFWWIDREKETCGFYGSQIFPPADQPTANLFREFQKAVYNSAT